MGGDYGRLSFDTLRDFAGVFIQQGHPILDSDWNEMVAIFERRLRAETVDIMGRAVVPRETPTGFEIRLGPDLNLLIGRGRMYVDGLLAENHGLIGFGAPPVLDRTRVVDGRPVGVLDEPISLAANDFIDYTAQPYMPVPPAWPLESSGPHIVYLDVWQREVTPLKDPRLLEPALGGIDSATRWQTVWQVRVLPDVGTATTCTTSLPTWDELIAPSPARLTTATVEFEDPDEPCLIPPGGGYRGLENQLYRVEIHTSGPLGTATFKWSRDNASVGASIEAIEDGTRITVRRIGRDSVLRFRTGDWVEITDDLREFSGLPGDIRQITVDEDNNELVLNAPLSPDLIPTNMGGDMAAARHSRVIKWDQSGQVLLADGTLLVDLDDPASDGLIPVPLNGEPVVLEAGITVIFSTATAGGALRSFDHWNFTARTATRSIDILSEAPPAGIHHHYARLAVVTLPETVSDCRTFWPPEFGSECGCTVCVSAEEHNNGTRTIQDAIASLPEEGGSICLGPGAYLLGETPVELTDLQSVRLRGHGYDTRLAYAGPGAALRIANGQDVRISDIGITALNAAGPDASEASAALSILHGLSITVERCALTVTGGHSADTGIMLSGLQLDVDIRENIIFAPNAVACVSERRDGQAAYCALMDTVIDNNLLFGERRGVALDGSVIHLGPTQVSGNIIFAGEAGVIVTGAGVPVDTAEEQEGADVWSASAVTVSGNSVTIARQADGIISGVPDIRILDNEISAVGGGIRDRPGSCIRLIEGLVPLPVPDGQIIGNRIGNVDGVGISIETEQSALLIKRNIVRDCRWGGISTAPEASIRTLSLADNVIERVASVGADFPVAAVRFSTMQEARIIDNIIRGVGREDASVPYRAGFDLRGVAMLDFSHNAISEILSGPEPNDGIGIGLFLDGVVITGDVSSNRILGSGEETGDRGTWAGLVIDLRRFRGQTASFEAKAVNTPEFPAYVTRSNRIYSLSLHGLRPFATQQSGHFRVTGNIISDAHSNTTLPQVFFLADTGTSACSFTDNHCVLMASGQAASLVRLAAQRLIVSNNVVRRSDDTDAIHLFCPVVNSRPQATVLGNITFGNIRVNGANLPTPFANLNILA